MKTIALSIALLLACAAAAMACGASHRHAAPARSSYDGRPCAIHWRKGCEATIRYHGWGS
jgi:hypothetical protein